MSNNRLKQLEKALAEATLSLVAIGYPSAHDPPDAHICGVIARSALIRVENALNPPDY